MDMFGGNLHQPSHMVPTFFLIFSLLVQAAPSWAYVSFSVLHILELVALNGANGSLPLESCVISLSVALANEFRAFHPPKSDNPLRNSPCLAQQPSLMREARFCLENRLSSQDADSQGQIGLYTVQKTVLPPALEDKTWYKMNLIEIMELDQAFCQSKVGRQVQVLYFGRKPNFGGTDIISQ